MRPPRPPPEPTAEIDQWVMQQALASDVRATLPDGRYLPWDELRHRQPPGELSHEQWWRLITLERSRSAIEVGEMAALYPLRFAYTAIPSLQRSLHAFDRRNVGHELLSALANPEAVTEYRVRQLIEEAISSSEIEGAKPTTRELARQMVREQREPASRDERMILNNWHAMQRILELRDRRLTVEDLLELHSILGEGALEVEDAAGKFREPQHEVAVTDLDGNIWHKPPPAEGLRERVAALLRFANGETGNETFIHPVVRAIIVHFWLGYEHPFRDGNGRIARALYYYCMLRQGYEIAEFLSISGPIDRSPKAYYMAFAHTEADDGDLTYFVLHQLQMMQLALEDLVEQLKERAEHTRVLAQTVARFDELNHRQRALLQHALRHPLESYTIESHATSHAVHYQTARTDLLDLEKRGHFEQRRVGKGKRFQPTAAFVKKLKGA